MFQIISFWTSRPLKVVPPSARIDSWSPLPTCSFWTCFNLFQSSSQKGDPTLWWNSRTTVFWKIHILWTSLDYYSNHYSRYTSIKQSRDSGKIATGTDLQCFGMNYELTACGTFCARSPKRAAPVRFHYCCSWLKWLKHIKTVWYILYAAAPCCALAKVLRPVAAC